MHAVVTLSEDMPYDPETGEYHIVKEIVTGLCKPRMNTGKLKVHIDGQFPGKALKFRHHVALIWEYINMQAIELQSLSSTAVLAI